MQNIIRMIVIVFMLNPVAGVAQEVPDSGDTVLIDGDWEVVFDWSTERCTEENIPDLAVRAYRGADKRINLIISHTEAYAMRGQSLDDLRIDCNPVSRSRENADPSQYTDKEWLASVYTEDGNTVYALVHNEFQGNNQPGAVCPSGEYYQCWNNTITMMVSKDGGRNFVHAATPPNHMVANVPQVYVPNGGVYGAFSPSNIIKKDGYYYAFLKIQTYFVETQHTCLIRTQDLSAPRSWRYWDGVAFKGEFADPYRAEIRSVSEHSCPPLALDEIAQLYEGVTYNTYLEKFVLIGVSSDPRKDPADYGFYYAFSEDLIHWERRKLLLEVPLPWTVLNPDEVNYLYPTLIDPGSASMNFETTGETAYLYFTRNNNGHTSLNRDLMRVRVVFTQGH
ncbi:MAG: hypothetical protein V3V13_12750 [Paracoccaceae bacterium]